MCRLGGEGTISFQGSAAKNELFTSGERKSRDRYYCGAGWRFFSRSGSWKVQSYFRVL